MKSKKMKTYNFIGADLDYFSPKPLIIFNRHSIPAPTLLSSSPLHLMELEIFNHIFLVINTSETFKALRCLQIVC